MPLKFPYFFDRGLWRPIIKVSFPTHRGEKFVADGLIDSGAPWCLFPGHIATILGHNTPKGRQPVQMAICGLLISSYLHQTTICVGNKYFLWDVYFSHDIDDWDFGILGQDPFFSNFQITFNYPKKEILLDPCF